MLTALALLAGATIVGCLAPAPLRRLAHSRMDPVAVIVAWLTAILGVTLTATTGITVLLLPQHGIPADLVSALHGCWAVLRHGSTPRVEQLAGLTGWVILVALAGRFAVIAVRAARRRGHARRERRAILRLAGRSQPGASPRETILWLEHDRPLAFSLTGRPGLVVATDGLARHLTATQLDAVLDHERAHLHGHHHTILSTVDTFGWALPFLPLFRRAPSALRDLVELAADATAARHHGAPALRTALMRVADHHDLPGAALAAGNHALDYRLRRLTLPPLASHPVRRLLRYGFVGATSLTLPLAIGLTGLLTVGAVFCPLP